MSHKRILIATGIYPPQIGGPAQYAKNMKEQFEKLGHEVMVKTYTTENKLPTGIRHIYFFFKIIPALLSADMIFILDTLSVGLPTVFASKIFRKKSIIRTGGDFLWENYVERTHKKVLLRNFYNTEKGHFTLKEKIIFKATKWTLKNVTHTIFSTEWQRNIFVNAYKLNEVRTSLVENFYGPKEEDKEYKSKEFVASTRKLVWKNLDVLDKVFDKIKREDKEVILFNDMLPFKELMHKMSESYAVILVSLGDISPNMILDAIRYNRPFICTKEVGIYDRIKDAGVFVDPLNEKEIEEAVLNLLESSKYEEARNKVRSFNFVHTWEEIAHEFIKTFEKI